MRSNCTENSVRYKSLKFMGYPLHRVGDDGSVWSKAKKWKEGKWRRLKPICWGRYPIVALSYRGKAKTFHLHSLVLIAFVGPKPDGMQGCHENGNREDNRLCNLRWDTPESNYKDRNKHGTHNKGERNGRARHTAVEIRRIRRLYATGRYSQSRLGQMFDMGQDQVSDVVLRKTWKDV